MLHINLTSKTRQIKDFFYRNNPDTPSKKSKTIREFEYMKILVTL